MIAPTGTKEVKIRVTGNEKNRITVIFLIDASGKKYKPFLIFKGKKEKKVFQSVQELEKYDVICTA